MGGGLNDTAEIRRRAAEIVKAEEERFRFAPESEQQATERKGIKFVSAGVLCASPCLPDWIIQGYLDSGSLSVLFAPPGAMKSFMALDQGLSIAANVPWQGNKIRKSGSVFYLCGEGFNGIGKRIKAWCLKHGVNPETIPFYVSDRCAQLTNPASALDVAAAVDELRELHGEPVLVIIDTLNRNFGNGDENSTKDMTSFVDGIDQSLRNRFGCAVLIVHHTGLANTDRARGAGSLRAALDWEYSLTPNNDGTKTLSCQKCKDFDPPKDISFKPEIITIPDWIDPDTGEPVSSVVLTRTEAAPHTAKQKPISPKRQIALDALIGLLNQYDFNNDRGVHIDSWRQAAYARGISDGGDRAKQKAFQDAREWLLANKIVTCQGEIYSPCVR